MGNKIQIEKKRSKEMEGILELGVINQNKKDFENDIKKPVS